MAKKRGKRSAKQGRVSNAPAASAAAEVLAPSSRRLELVEDSDRDSDGDVEVASKARASKPEQRLQSGEHRRVQGARRAPASDPPPADVAAIPEDEISIPPAADVDMDRFFAEGDSTPVLPDAPSSAHGLADHDHDEAPPSSRHLDPDVRERRARFAKRVKWVVAVAAVLGLAGFVRGALNRPDAPAPAAAAVAAPKVEAAPAKPSAPEEAKPAEAKPAAAEAKPAEVKAEVAAADKEAKAADGTKPAEVKPADVKDEPKAAPAAAAAAAESGDKPAKTAAQEKADARRALERGRAGEAIEAGERSVAADPTDGEAWLILGAAYQDKGRGGDARKAFASCLKQGKRGPVNECAAMLQ